VPENVLLSQRLQEMFYFSPLNHPRSEFFSRSNRTVLRFQLWSGLGPCADLPGSDNLAARRDHRLSQSAFKGLDPN